jgi:hypothetical protein
MARHTVVPSSPNQPARLTPAQKREAISRLRKRLQELEAFNPNSVERSYDPPVVTLRQALDRTLVHIFGATSVDYDRYKSISNLGEVPFVAMRSKSPKDWRLSRSSSRIARSEPARRSCSRPAPERPDQSGLSISSAPGSTPRMIATSPSCPA